MSVDETAVPPRFPAAAGIFLGLGLGGLFDGIVLHQLLQWHHMATSAGYPVEGVEPAQDALRNLKLNTFLDGIFHAGTYVLILLGLFGLWKAPHRAQVHGSTRVLVGTFLIGFGLFNLIEGTLDHFILGLHHVNETVPADQWIYWDLEFLLWGAAMVIGGWLICRTGRHAERAGRSRP